MTLPKKIIVHLGDETEYRSFVRNLYDNNEKLNLLGVNCHNNLFEIYYQNKPNMMIFCTSEYTKEIHDFIGEYQNQKPKIVLFINSIIDNPNIIKFWNDAGVVVIGSSKNIDPSLIEDRKYIYDKLYDSKIYIKLDNAMRNDKIAVLLSDDNHKNDQYLQNILYPMTKEKLVLFNSMSYRHSQNVGILNPTDLCLILNTYKSLLDLDNKYEIEASVCGIDNISTTGNILDNIQHDIRKSRNEHIENLSYDFFIKNVFLTLIKDNI